MNNTTLIDTLWVPTDKLDKKIRNLIILFLGSWFLAFMAQLSFPLLFSPVPITGQTLAVLIIGSSYGSKRAACTVLLYIAQGAIGLPFFAGGQAGLAILHGATSGYLLGFVLSAYVMGHLAEKKMDRLVRSSIVIFFVGHFIIYFCGLVVLSFFVGEKNVFMMGLIPFIPGLIIKSLMASLLLPTAWKLIGRN